MNHQMMLNAMERSISEVLEQMFFLPVEIGGRASEEDDFVPAEEMIVVQIGFEGPVKGAFLIFIPSALAESVTADFLGTSVEEIPTDQVEGTIMEMINMLAGNVLHYYDQKTPSDLKLPCLIKDRTACNAAFRAAQRMTLHVKTIESRIVFKFIRHNSSDRFSSD